MDPKRFTRADGSQVGFDCEQALKMIAHPVPEGYDPLGEGEADRDRSGRMGCVSSEPGGKEWIVIISGVVMASRKGRLKQLCESVDAIPWAEVRFTDPKGRVVATIEARDVEESATHLKELQHLPDAVMAELSQFCIEDGDAGIRNPALSDSMVENQND